MIWFSFFHLLHWIIRTSRLDFMNWKWGGLNTCFWVYILFSYFLLLAPPFLSSKGKLFCTKSSERQFLKISHFDGFILTFWMTNGSYILLHIILFKSSNFTYLLFRNLLLIYLFDPFNKCNSGFLPGEHYCILIRYVLLLRFIINRFRKLNNYF